MFVHVKRQNGRGERFSSSEPLCNLDSSLTDVHRSVWGMKPCWIANATQTVGEKKVHPGDECTAAYCKLQSTYRLNRTGPRGKQWPRMMNAAADFNMSAKPSVCSYTRL